MEATEKLDLIYEKFKDKFSNSFFHGVLWKILIDEVHKGKQIAFTAIVKDGYNQLGLAIKNERGYIPTMAIFNSDNYDECENVCDELNKELFNISDRQASEIVLSSL